MKKWMKVMYIGLFTLLMSGFAVAGNFLLRYGGNDIFEVDTSGNVNASGFISERGNLIRDVYLNESDNATIYGYISDQLATVAGNSTTEMGVALDNTTIQRTYLMSIYNGTWNADTIDTLDSTTFAQVGWSNITYDSEVGAEGFFNDIGNFTTTLVDDDICVYYTDTGTISCNYTDQTGSSVDDVWVNVTGDTMSGDLSLGTGADLNISTGAVKRDGLSNISIDATGNVIIVLG